MKDKNFVKLKNFIIKKIKETKNVKELNTFLVSSLVAIVYLRRI